MYEASDDEADQLIDLLKLNGAIQCLIDSPNANVPATCTHIITDTLNISQVQQILQKADTENEKAVDHLDTENFKSLSPALVNPTWVRRCIEAEFRLDTRYFSPDPQMIFSGVILTCADDVPISDQEIIYGAVIAFGGGSRHQITPEVTHVLSTTGTGEVVSQANIIQARCQMFIVTPHWFQDSFECRQKVPEEKYTWPDPIILQDQPVQNGDEGWNRSHRAHLFNMQSVVQSNELDHATSTVKHVGALPQQLLMPALSGKRICLSEDLGFNSSLEKNHSLFKTLKSVLTSAGAIVDSDVSEADVVICKYRNKSTYRQALLQGKTIGSAAWLFHVLATATLIDPLSSFLMYPHPKQGVPGFDKLLITASNYTGIAREYIRNLIVSLGAQYSTSMSPKTTHVVTCVLEGMKANAAQLWGTQLVNHLWLEDCFRQWKYVSEEEARYHHWTPGTSSQATLSLAALTQDDIKPWLMAAKENRDYDPTQETIDPILSTQSNEQFAVERELLAGNKEVLRSPSSNANLSEKENHKASKTKISIPDEENTPQAHGSSQTRVGRSRKAAQAAARILVDQGHDIIRFEQELKTESVQRKRKGNSAYNSSQVNDENDDATPSRHKTVNTTELSANKRARTAPSPKIITTGIEISDSTLKAMRNLGCSIVTSTATATHLVTKQIMRTEKFLCAIAQSTYILDQAWITDCVAAKELLSEDAYMLKDPTSEEKFDFKLATSLTRAKRAPILRDHTFWITQKVRPEFELLKRIVRAHGGQANRQSTSSIRNFEHDPTQNHLICCEEDGALYRTMLKSYPALVAYDTEQILTSVLKQEIDLEKHVLDLA